MKSPIAAEICVRVRRPCGRCTGRCGQVRDLQRQLHGVWFDPRHLDGLRDEAPSAYKDIQVVMRAQRDLTRITRRLTPMLFFKDVGRHR